MRGRCYWPSYTVEGISKALVCYYEAIAEDENFALAYSGIADYYNFLSVFGVMSPEDSFPAAKEAAEKAISLDKNLAEAYTSLGITAYGYDWDYQKSKEYLEKSLQLKPNSGEAHLWYGYLCGLLGNHEKAIKELEKAENLNPQSPSIPVSYALTLRNARQFEKGLAKLQRALTIQPNNPTALQGYCWFVNGLKNFDEAEEMCKKAVEVSERQNLPLYAYGYTLASVGKVAEARKILEELNERQKGQYVPPIYFALIHTALGEFDLAFEWLDKCFAVRDFWVIWLPIDPRFDSLRQDKRFAEYCQRIKPLTSTGDEIHQSHIATKIFVAETEPKTKPLPVKPNFFQRHKYKFGVAAILLILLSIGYATGFIAFKFSYNDLSPELQNQSATKRTMAILPFKNETGNPENDFLCDGLSDNLINRLSYLPEVQVIPRSTSFKFKGKEIAPKQAGTEMKVETVLSGKLNKHNDNVEIYLELVNVADGSKIWSSQYNHKDLELIALQNQMASDLATQFKKGGEDQTLSKSFTENPKAFELYLKGEFERQKSTPEGTRKAIEFYKQALDLDANYALAYQGLALAYRNSPAYGTLAPNEAYPLAKESAMKALAIDPTLGTVYVPLASIKATYDWDFAGAEREYKQAIQFAPNNTEAHFSYGNFLVAMARTDEGLMQLRIAQQLDPQSTNIATNIGWALYIAGRFDEAETQIKQVLARDPNFARAYMNLGEIYEEQGKFDEAIANFQKSKQLSGDILADMALGHAYAAAGRKTEALKIAADLESKVLKKEVSPFLPAVVYAGLDEKDKSFYWLERAFQERSNWLTLTKIGRRLKLLHSDPRFDDLLKRIGF
ncbi:MAG TPA: tetratricopeptide repeat protein [Pyrinomonadaceae bacterium]|nr:tetratricopeptide repeat protein [Pyrinomonadaceae bacterium]